MAPPARKLVLCAEDTDAGSVACEWIVNELYKDGDVIHFVYVVKCMKPPMSIFHGMPGTAYDFNQPGAHHELQHIESAKTLLRQRYIPLLTPKNVKYELHLFAEQRDAPADKVGPIILQASTQIDPACVVTAAHNKVVEEDRYMGDMGSVTKYLLENCLLPLIIVPPIQDGMETGTETE